MYDDDSMLEYGYITQFRIGSRIRVIGNSEAEYTGHKIFTGKVRLVRGDDSIELDCDQTCRLELIKKGDGIVEKI